MLNTTYFTFILSLFALSAQAAVYSWHDCVDLVARQNPELSASQSNRQGAIATVAQNRSFFIPQLSAELGRQERGTGTLFQQGSETWNATLRASQNLFAGFQDWGRLEQSRSQLLAADASLESVRARVSYELKSAFEGMRFAKEYGQLTSEIIRRREENFRLVELRFQSGRENKGSVLLSQAYLEQARLDDLQAKNALRTARAQLARTLGIDDAESVEISGEIPVSELSGQRPLMSDLALQTPDYLKAQAEAQAAEQAVVRSRSTFMPSLDLTGSVGRESQDFFPSGRAQWTVGLSLTFPFFTGGQDYYGLESQHHARAAALSLRHNVSRQMLARLEQAYAAYSEALMKFKVDQRFREASQVRAEIARKRYNNGLLTFEDWDIIESDLIARQKSYLQSWRDRVIAEAAWEQAQGKGALP